MRAKFVCFFDSFWWMVEGTSRLSEEKYSTHVLFPWHSYDGSKLLSQSVSRTPAKSNFYAAERASW